MPDSYFGGFVSGSSISYVSMRGLGDLPSEEYLSAEHCITGCRRSHQ